MSKVKANGKKNNEVEFLFNRGELASIVKTLCGVIIMLHEDYKREIDRLKRKKNKN